MTKYEKLMESESKLEVAAFLFDFAYKVIDDFGNFNFPRFMAYMDYLDEPYNGQEHELK